jgi:hypothetical protein
VFLIVALLFLRIGRDLREVVQMTVRGSATVSKLKYEIRNTKPKCSKRQNAEYAGGEGEPGTSCLEPLKFGHFDLFRISGFDIRI